MDNTYINVKRGDIFFIVDNSRQENKTIGSEQWAGRPAIIVSNDIGNNVAPIVEIVYLTAQEKPNNMPTHVRIHSSKKPSLALCEQIQTISKDRLGNKVGHITPGEQYEIDKALAISIGIKVKTQAE